MRLHRVGAVAAVALAAALVLLVLRALHRPAEGPAILGGPAARLFESPHAATNGDGRRPETPPVPGAPSIRGIVVDGKGRPIEGAEVGAAREGERVPSRGRTGADGRFDLPAGSADGGYLVGVRAAGMASMLQGGVRPGAGDLRFVLWPGVVLQGAVRDQSGGPCPGARVRAALRFPGVPMDLGGFETRADESGRYRFEGLPPVEGSLKATYLESPSDPVEFTLPPGTRSVERNIVVARGLVLDGVVRGADGSLLPGIMVSAEHPVKKECRTVVTDSAGRFEFGGLEAVPFDLLAVDPPSLWLDSAHRTATPPERGIEIVLERNPSPPAYATFRVVDEEGREIRFVRTRTFGGEGPEQTGPEQTGTGSLTADGSGLFRTGRLQPGRLRLDLRTPSGIGSTGAFAVESGRIADLGTVRLSPGAAVRGRVLDPDGRPAEGARIFADDDELPEPMPLGADGTFALQGLPPGGGRLRIRLVGCAELPASWSAAAGATADLGDLRLRRATGAVRGTVRSKSGSRVDGAQVSLTPRDDFGPGSDGRRLLAGPDGRFEAGTLAPGRWLLSAMPPKTKEEEPASSRFSSNAQGIRVELGENEQKEVVLEIE